MITFLINSVPLVWDLQDFSPADQPEISLLVCMDDPLWLQAMPVELNCEIIPRDYLEYDLDESNFYRTTGHQYFVKMQYLFNL